MLELLFVIGLSIMLMVTGVSLLDIIAALVVVTAIMFLGDMLTLMIKLLSRLLLATTVVWVIKAIKAPKVPRYQCYNRWRHQGTIQMTAIQGFILETKQELIIKSVTTAPLTDSSCYALHTTEL